MALLTLAWATGVVAAPNQPPIANAGSDRTGSTNVAITLSGSGSYDPDGTVAAYWWQFGDGTSVTTGSATVSHVYAAAKIYTATLWVRDNAGTWSARSDTARVTIGSGGTITTTTTSRPPTTTTLAGNQPPVAAAGPNQAVQSLLNVTLDGRGSRDNDGVITTAAWNFGDGTGAWGLTTTHAYARPGTYTATLLVLDDDGALGTDTAVITVANRAPIANAGPDRAGTPGAAVVLDGSGSRDLDGTITGYAWTFGDGTSGTGPTPSHAYANAGTYTATLTVTDDKGARASDAAAVTVSGGGSATWARSVGSTSSDGGYAIRGDAAGNTVVAGTYRGTVTVGGTTLRSAGGADGFIVKYSPTGAILWARSVGGTADDAVEAVAVDAAGDVVVAGRFSGTASFGGTSLAANGSSDIVVAKFAAANGAHQWSRRYGGTYDDGAAAVAVDGSRNVYVTGYFRGTADFGGGPLSVPYVSDLDVFLLKLSPTGAYAWAKNFPNDGNDRGYGVAADGAGNVALTGNFSNSINFGGGALTSLNAMTDVFVARFTTNGAHSWSRRFGAADGNESGYGTAIDGSGNVIVAGYAMKAVDFGGGVLSALGGTDGFVAKYSASSGAHVWSRRLGGTANDYAYDLAVDGTNNVFVAGSFGGVANFGGLSLPVVGDTDAFVAKYAANGGLGWARGLGGLSSDVGRAVGLAAGQPVASGYFYGSGLFAGTTLSSAGMSDGFVARLAP